MSENKKFSCTQCSRTAPRRFSGDVCNACRHKAAGPATPEVETKRPQPSASRERKAREAEAKLPPLDVLPSEFEVEVKHAKRAARLKVLKDYFTQAYMEGDELDSMPSVARDFIRNIVEKAEAKEASKKSSEMWFITVNPAVGHTLAELQARVLKALKKKYVASALYCYEITDNSSRSPHCHMLLTLTESKTPSIIKREFGNTFKALGAIDVKMVPNLDEYDKVSNYVMGTKDDPQKMADLRDIVQPWRDAQGLDAFYEYVAEAN